MGTSWISRPRGPQMIWSWILDGLAASKSIPGIPWVIPGASGNICGIPSTSQPGQLQLRRCARTAMASVGLRRSKTSHEVHLHRGSQNQAPRGSSSKGGKVGWTWMVVELGMIEIGIYKLLLPKCFASSRPLKFYWQYWPRQLSESSVSFSTSRLGTIVPRSFIKRQFGFSVNYIQMGWMYCICINLYAFVSPLVARIRHRTCNIPRYKLRQKKTWEPQFQWLEITCFLGTRPTIDLWASWDAAGAGISPTRKILKRTWSQML